MAHTAAFSQGQKLLRMNYGARTYADFCPEDLAFTRIRAGECDLNVFSLVDPLTKWNFDVLNTVAPSHAAAAAKQRRLFAKNRRFGFSRDAAKFHRIVELNVISRGSPETALIIQLLFMTLIRWTSGLFRSTKVLLRHTA